MSEFITDPSAEDLPSEELRWLLAFWNELRGTREMPARADFSPADMVPLLPYIGLVDVEHDPQRFRTRLAGTGIVQETGADWTGVYYDEMLNSEEISHRAAWVTENRQPCFANDLPLSWASRDFTSYRVLVMPLSADGEQVDMLLIYVDFD